MKFPTIKEMAEEVAEKALDEFEYKGKTLRQWVEIISASELGANLAEVGTDCISRQAAIDIAPKLIITLDGYEMHNQAVTNYCAEITQLPPIQPEPQYKTDYGFMWLCPKCGLPVHSDYTKCVRCGHNREKGV